MDIQTIAIDQINPAVYNPRKDLGPGDPDYDKLEKSMVEFDYIDPLIWNKRSGNLVGGHQRLKILKSWDFKVVDVSVVDLDDTKEKALNLALNKISGDWDNPLLKDLLLELDTGEFDIEITGFDLDEIAELMNQFHTPEEGLTDDDAIPEATESICKKGDLWQLGNHRLLCGDATVITDVEKLMGGEKADMVFTDPPYGKDIVKDNMVGADFGVAKKGKYKAIKNDNLNMEVAIFLTLAPKALIWGGNYFADQLPISATWIIWDKRGDTGIKNTFADCELAWSNYGGPARVFKQLWNGMIREGEHDKRVHPTQKPVGLFTEILEVYKGSIILDPFGGSGSTLIACEKLGRRCFMMEISEMYCTVILKRWEAYTGKQAVLVSGATDV